MHPVLFRLGDFEVYSWGAAFMISILAGVAVSVRRSPRFGVAPETVRNLAIP